MNQTETETLKDFFLHDEFARQNGIEIVEIVGLVGLERLSKTK